MDNLFRKTWVEVDLGAIHDNVVAFRRHLHDHQQLMVVVKADGYGHGAEQVADQALQAGANWLGVALLEEALALRQAGFSAPILVLGFIDAEHMSVARQHNISVMINDLDHFHTVYAQLDDQGQSPLHVHIKVDTGMGRLGMRDKGEFEQLCQDYMNLQKDDPHFSTRLHWEGMYTHLATADEADLAFLTEQQDHLSEYIQLLHQHGVNVPFAHMSNSAGIVRRLNDPQTNIVRLGISTYGLAPSPYMKANLLPFTLKPAFSLHSRLVHVKKISSGDSVSYGQTYKAHEETWIGTLAIGYADGLSRNLSNKAQALIEGKRVNLVGRICMDLTMIKLDQPYPRGTKVTLIGQQNELEVSMDEMANHLNTINYEIPCMISSRVPRIYKHFSPKC